MEEVKKEFKAGFVAVAGRPNVGKSTLVNALLHQKVAAVSPRPQTTRRNQLGILTNKQAQIIFVDTPGLHSPKHKLGEFMNQEAFEAVIDADLVLWLLDCNVPFTDEDKAIGERLKSVSKLPPVVILMTKIDLVKSSDQPALQAKALELFPAQSILPVSAYSGQGLEKLLDMIISYLPDGHLYYDADQVTDLYERDIAADLIREAALQHLEDEIPHGIAVRVDEYTERGDTGAFIQATMFVERESHKGIVIGQGGLMLKKIGSAARAAIEEMSGRKVFLEIRVKVNKNWRDSQEGLKTFGYYREKEG